MTQLKLPIYLDYMSTTPVDPRVAEKMLRYLTPDGEFGNASSRTHIYGKNAAEAVEHARQQVADLINCEPQALIWTSGATEANNLALKGAAHFYQRQGHHIITCQTEHQSVLDPCAQLEREGFTVTYLPVLPNGLLDLDQLKNAIRPDTILVSIMHANNETGVIQDIAAIGKLTRERGILFHVDAAQSAGKIAIDLKNTAVDLMSLNAHKVYGPKGIGALYMRQKPRVRLVPLMQGGGQEMGLRPGTLATHQIVGMGEAFKLAREEMPEESARLLTYREILLKGLEHLVFPGSAVGWAKDPAAFAGDVPTMTTNTVFPGSAVGWAKDPAAFAGDVPTMTTNTVFPGSAVGWAKDPAAFAGDVPTMTTNTVFPGSAGSLPANKVHLNGDLIHRLPGNLNISFLGIDSQVLIDSARDLAVSSGSACTSGNLEPSHVLLAMGSEALARSAIRFSFGRFTTEEEIEFAVSAICNAIKNFVYDKNLLGHL